MKFFIGRVFVGSSILMPYNKRALKLSFMLVSKKIEI